MSSLRLRPVDHEIWRLALPAFGALVAEPLYILADTAVVGRIGTQELGGLALASQVLLIFVAVFIFLAYGTTAAVSRLLGAGQHVEAARTAVQSLWLATAMGIVFAAAAALLADPLLRLLGGEGRVLESAVIYLRVSTFGLPAMMIMLAGVGYLRGLQDTVRPLIVAIVTALGNLLLELWLVFGLGYGIGASALSTVVFQWVGAGMYVWWVARAVRAHNVSLAPDRASITRLAAAGADLFVRTAALRGSFILATAVAARIGDAELAGHEVAFALWSFAAFVLDSVAIAGQSMLGMRLGASDVAGARAVGRRITEWGAFLGVIAMALVLLGRPWLPGLFSEDPAVIEVAGTLLIVMAIMQPINGIVFALDGILIGAGDLRFLAVAMAASAAVFVPLAIIVAATGAGIVWLWVTLAVFMGARMVGMVGRLFTDHWLVVGSAVQ